jgi:hypothetical protein
MFHSRFCVPRSLFAFAGFAVLLGLALSIAPPARADDVVLELVEVVPDPMNAQWPEVRDGYAKSVDPNYGNFYSEHSWSALPKQIGPEGFALTLTVKAESKTGGGITMGTEVGATGFSFDVAEHVVWARVAVGAPGADGGSLTLHVTPSGMSPGSTAELKIGGTYGAHVIYKYQARAGTASGTGPGANAGGEERKLAAHLDCPGSIVISELPSLNCHIVVTSWRYSADPVEVILPNALDTYGNHANGIQLLQAAGSQDATNWSYPSPYNWGMFVFACPAQSGTAANCFGSVTLPGPQAVDILVRQGPDEVRLKLTLNAIARPGATAQAPGAAACGFALGPAILAKWTQMGGQNGVLGCPTGNEQTGSASVSGTTARYAMFKNGAIFEHTSGALEGGVFEVHGCIGNAYLTGPAAPWLGLPVSDEYDIPGGRRSDFEGGYFAWDRLTGGCMALKDGANTVSFEPDSNRMGNDYTRFEVIGDRMEICRDACAADSSCRAFTYVHAGGQGPRGMCWLKSEIPPANNDGCCISGVKR